MTFLRKLQRICAAMCMVLFFLGCGDRKQEGVSITFLDTEDKSDAWAEIIANFEERHPGIDVQLIEGPASTDTRETQYATTLLAEDSTYDLIWMDVIWLPKFVAKGWLVELDDRFTPQMQAEYLEGDIKASKYRGKTYRIPIRSNGQTA